ncbi:DNA-binding transcriptional regulator, IclR family [Amycolatopsis arida]|uniref:DNA-binding transcriptional regulator, IclR family n=1 Tax=Amycolatopsis arida TaxID=587909 RepID=A0A1I5SQI3_9PSEU|nr:IclR family transcriptional regulator [Amycolatopsis arida]TDX96403.1 DNA-binding IclR family transcriptional regulator [Amycolatopsis arida]SFP72546.1 DNA-binding transcriptional regulator, IclR family [Amycolatopsis arida]
MAGNGSDPGRSVTARALALLAAFDPAHPRLTLSVMARRAGLPLATAHRLAAELEAWGALDRDGDGGYRIGLRLWEVGLLAPVSGRLREVALPFMQELYEATRENIHLAVRDGFDALYVEKLSGHRSVSIISRTGSRLPLHSTGVGKVLLAEAAPEFVEAYCRRPLPQFTRHTIGTPGRLRRELRTTLERGYALTNEEMTLGSCSVAVPVSHPDPVPPVALGIVVHTVRADLPKLVPALRSAAEGIARALTG